MNTSDHRALDVTWGAQTLADLAATLDQLWPNVDEDRRDALVRGIATAAARVRPAEVFSAVLAIAEGGRSTLPSAGTIMRQVNERRALTQGQTPSGARRALPARSEGHPPWTAALGLATFVVAGGRERFRSLSPAMQDALRPWCRLVNDLGVTFDTADTLSPGHNPALYREAERRGEAIWNEHGGPATFEAVQVVSSFTRAKGKR